MLKDKEILLGVSGSIAAYKSAEFARELVKKEAKVQVLMTKGACEFVAPLTFFSLTGREVYHEMFSGGEEVATAHIELARRADILVIAPATARMISRIATGSAEDLLSTSVIAADCPVVVAPAMNAQMFRHPGVRENLEKISHWPNYFIAPPSRGELACGEWGFGRLIDTKELVTFTEWVLSGGKQDLRGERILVTAGPTFEDIDPVRFLSNRSTGKMGFALAEAAMQRGAEVDLITSVPHLSIPAGCRALNARSAHEMAEAVESHIEKCSILLMAAAVADYKPAEYAINKLKKSEDELSLRLARTKDILKSLPLAKKTGRKIVGFAAETDNILANANHKMLKKQLDMIVVNNVQEEGCGFGTETNRVSLLRPNQDAIHLPMMTKIEVAHGIFDCLLQTTIHQ